MKKDFQQAVYSIVSVPTTAYLQDFMAILRERDIILICRGNIGTHTR